MRVAMKFVTKHGDGRLIFKRDIPVELRAAARKTTWQRSLGSRHWNSKVAVRYERLMAESDRAFADWRRDGASPQTVGTSSPLIALPGETSFDPVQWHWERDNPAQAIANDLVRAGILPGRITSDRQAVQLDAVVKRWASERNVRPASVSDMTTAVAVLKAACGIKGIDEYDHADAQKAKAAVLSEAIRNGTKRKRWNMLSALFAFAKANALVSVDVFRGVALELEKDAEKRVVWTVSALNELFATPVFTKQERPRAGGGEAAYWLPVLCLFHGNRLSEFAQLRLSDVTYEKSQVGLRISDEGEDQHVKNSASVRMVPLHPAVRSDFLKLLDWTKKRHGDGPLFPLVKPDKMRRSAGRWSTWFTKYRREQEIYVWRQDAHAFRHTHISACREASIPTDVFSRWTGHTLSDVVQSYGSMSLAAMAKEIAKVKYPKLRLPAWKPGA